MRTSTFGEEFYAAIPAKKTLYNGVEYRSRLEAWWAAFFDECGWKHEYEPKVSGYRKPDFVLHGLNKDVYVEVKPTDEVDNDVFEAAKDWRCGSDIMLLGRCPDFTRNIVRLGWMSESERIGGDIAYSLPDEVFISDRGSGLDFFHSSGHRNNVMRGSSTVVLADKKFVEGLWVCAGLTLQNGDIQ